MSPAQRRVERLRLLSSVTAEEALLLAAAPYERPAVMARREVSTRRGDVLTGLEDRALVERDPQAQKVYRYRCTETGQAIADALRAELPTIGARDDSRLQAGVDAFEQEVLGQTPKKAARPKARSRRA